MTHRIFNIVATLSLVGLLFTGPSFAQDARIFLKFDHDFVVGTRTLPAGKYRIRHAMANDACVFVIENVESGHSSILRAVLDSEAGTPEDNIITFARYGDQYFLTNVCSAGDNRVFKFDSSAGKQEALARAGLKRELISVRASLGR
jgi:hypothetical protein